MNKVLTIILACLLSICIAASVIYIINPSIYSEDSEQLIEDIELITDYRTEKGAENASQSAEEKNEIWLMGINCQIHTIGSNQPAVCSSTTLIDGYSVTASHCIAIDGSFMTQARIEDDAILDHWVINGTPIDSTDKELVLEITESTIIEAVLLENIEVTSINAVMYELDDIGNPIGDPFDYRLYERTIANITQPIKLSVNAAVPEGFLVDYWLINGVPVSFPNNTGFGVNGLTTSSVFIAVIMEGSLPQTSELPAITPTIVTPEPDDDTVTPTPYITPTPTPTPTPQPNMVTVTCINATFSCAYFASASSGSVPEGTEITVTGLVDVNMEQLGWKIDSTFYLINNPYGKTFTYVVNSDTIFEYTGVVN